MKRWILMIVMSMLGQLVIVSLFSMPFACLENRSPLRRGSDVSSDLLLALRIVRRQGAGLMLRSSKVIVFSSPSFVREELEEEEVEISAETVNPKLEMRLGPSDFELRTVLGQGGYGKVSFPLCFSSFFEQYTCPVALLIGKVCKPIFV